jgi:hypothetical protein
VAFPSKKLTPQQQAKMYVTCLFQTACWSCHHISFVLDQLHTKH